MKEQTSDPNEEFEVINVDSNIVFDELTEAKENGYLTVSEQGSARSGKTYNTMIWLVLQCLANDGMTVSVVRATMPALRGSVFRDFLEIVDKLDVYDRKALNKSEMTYTFPNGSWMEFFSVDNEQKLRGRKRRILYVNEANEISALEFQQLQFRTTEFTVIDYNPSFSDEHWICTDLNNDPRTYHFITTFRDNPFLEKRVIEEIEALKDKNQSLWRVYGLGLQAIIEGLIFPNVETIDEFPERCKRQWLGVDYGFTNDPTAIIRVGVDGDNVYLDELCYKTQMLTRDIISELRYANKTSKRFFKIISESADPRMIQEIAMAGLDIHPVKKYPGSVEAGILFLQEKKLHITKASFNLRKEQRNYTYRQDKDGKWLNQPIDAFNHAWDAVRYVMMNELMGRNKNPLSINQIAEIL